MINRSKQTPHVSLSTFHLRMPWWCVDGGRVDVDVGGVDVLVPIQIE